MICEQRICLSSAGNAELITQRSLVQIQPAQRNRRSEAIFDLDRDLSGLQIVLKNPARFSGGAHPKTPGRWPGGSLFPISQAQRGSNCKPIANARSRSWSDGERSACGGGAPGGQIRLPADCTSARHRKHASRSSRMNIYSAAISRSGCAQARGRQSRGRPPGRRCRSRGLTPLGRTRHRAIPG